MNDQSIDPQGSVGKYKEHRTKGRLFYIVIFGLFTGAADDDPPVSGTDVSAGARFGLGILKIAPVVTWFV